MTTSRVGRCRAGRRGFTLAEATLAMVLIGIAAAGVLLPFAGGASVQAAGQHRTLAAMLANSLIEQIAATPFDTIVATYNYTEPLGQMKGASGATMTDSMYANFSREVSCQYVHVPQQSADLTANFILATVKVYYGERTIVTANRLIGK